VLHKLTENVDEDVEKMLDEADFHILPVINVDGYA